MRIRLLGVGVKMGIVDRGHAQSDDVIRCPETFADHEYGYETSFKDKGGSNTPGWLKQARKPFSAEQLTKET